MASAGWHGGATLIAPSAHGGAVAGHGGAAAVIAPASWGGSSWGGHGGWGGGWNGWNGGWGGGWAGAGHNGQWVPDHSERHFDDGSYRPEHHYGGGHHW